ncbi:MAG: tandem-95 repeat protein [Gammaproteobacteria bacterium]|nr:tandem-95 repeat protein [Gammaproteobacteria bacterium]
MMLRWIRSNPIRRRSITLLASCLACIVSGAVQASITSASVPQQINMQFAQLPLSFVRNMGQVGREIQYYERADAHATFFAPDAVHFRFSGTSPSDGDELTLRFLGNAPDGRSWTARTRLPGHVNYIIGQDPKKWFYGIPMFKEVVYEQAFPGTDIHFYGNQRRLEYDIVLAPGADPALLRFAYEGAKALSLNGGGDLEIHLGGGTIIQNRPTIFQEIGGVRHAVSGAFVLVRHDGGDSARQPLQYGFELGAYDPRYPLVIDPVLIYSTYLGGTNHDHAHGVAVDASGNAYIAGETRSFSFPIVAPIQTAMAGDEDAFITKLDPSGTSVLYSTYLGGNNHDEAYGISVDASGNAYLSGHTRSSTFPVSASAYQSALAGNEDAFLIELDPTGALLYATYFGGKWDDRSFANVNDGTGAVYLGGATSSSDFPIQSAYQSTRGGDEDAFVAKIDTTKAGAASLIYSTYLGGKKDDIANSIAVNGLGEVFIVGSTESKTPGGPAFPVTANAYQATLSGEEDAFLARLSASGNSLIYSTYLGGSKAEEGWGLALSGNSVAFVTGSTESKANGSGTAFPTTIGALQTTHVGEKDAFLTEIDTSIGGASGLLYSTYIGGSNKDVGYAVAVDVSGRAHVTGYSKVTDKTLFPVTADAIQNLYAGNEDAFYLILDPTQSGTSGLIYSTYLGGKKFDQGRGIALDSAANAYITGKTRSDGAQSFPTTSGSFQSFSAGNEDAFIAKIGTTPNAPPVSGADPVLSVNEGTSVTSGDVLANDYDPEGNPLTITAYDATTTNGGSVVYNNNGTFTYTASSGFWGADSFTYTVSDGAGGTTVVTQSVTVNGLPVIGADPTLFVSGGENVTSGNVLANDVDPEGGPLTITAYDAATANGGTVFYYGNGSFVYTAANTYAGIDTFTYTVSDGAGGNVVVTQTVIVNGLPIVGADPVLMVSGGGTVTSGNVLANDYDPEGKPLSVMIFDATTPNGGTIVYHNNGTFSYTAATAFAGTDSFSYTVSDGVGGTVYVIQTVTVNGLPVIGADPALSVANGGTITTGNVLANDADPEGNPLTIISFSATTPNGGTVVYNNNGTFTYTALAGFHGVDTFTYTVSDGAGGTVVVTQSVTVANMCISSPVSVPTGASVGVALSANIGVQYSGVSSTGISCLTNPETYTPLPTGYRPGTKPNIFALSTTVATTGNTQICLVYDPSNYLRTAGLKLMVYQGGKWVDITSSLNLSTNTICGLSTSAIGTFALIEELPTAISLRSFNVARAGDGVDIRWVTTSETDNWGFRILRGPSPEGPFETLNAELIPALGGPGLDMNYHFTDYSAPAGQDYYYRLQDVDIRGLISEHNVVALRDVSTRTTSLARTSSSVTGASTTNSGGNRDAQVAASSQSGALVLPVESVAHEEPLGVSSQILETDQSATVLAVQAGSPVRYEPATTVEAGRPMALGEVLAPPVGSEIRAAAAEAPGDIESAFDFEVDIADAKGNHILVKRDEDTANDGEFIVSREEGGSYRLDWRVRDLKQVQGFAVYRREGTSAGHQVSGDFEKIVGFIPNYGQGDHHAYRYTFVDRSANADTVYDYEVRVIEWGLGARDGAVLRTKLAANL